MDDPAWAEATVDEVLTAVCGDDNLAVVLLADRTTMQAESLALPAATTLMREDRVDRGSTGPSERGSRNCGQSQIQGCNRPCALLFSRRQGPHRPCPAIARWARPLPTARRGGGLGVNSAPRGRGASVGPGR
ncbi:DUF6924 domain-containing protein [Streptomyces sp. NPDC020192]|uniref:DUF6924 domain-containing protein n=1 Tax=Streptomyces sp. NPDC020192 TaxID=3365066 RepID=UPI0037BD7240